MSKKVKLLKPIKVHWSMVVVRLSYDLSLDRFSREYILARLSKEGPSFLTKTLPQLSKAVLLGLETGNYCVIDEKTSTYKPGCTAFARKGKSQLPRFLYGWLKRIFYDDGRLVEEPDPEIIKKIRQLCDYFYKLSFDFTEADKERGYNKVKELEQDNKSRSVAPSWIGLVRKAFFALYGKSINEGITEILSRHRPRYTPGAFFGSEKLPKDLHFSIYKKRPSLEVGVTSKGYKGICGYFKAYPSSPEHCNLVPEGKVSKTLLVPKDSRGPRLISKEPMHLLRLQMSFFDYLTGKLERLSRGTINFTDQEINRELARKSSIDRKYSTLDLKDASDRILFKFAIGVFRGTSINWFLLNARSSHTLVNGDKIPLAKVAGMGSGLTFPLLALLTQLSVIASVKNRYPVLSYEYIRDRIFVYGDDLIVPKEWTNLARAGLTSSGLEVNANKSFSMGFFRESCGGDYYKGVSVSPVRLKLSNSGLGTPSDHKWGAHFTGSHSLLQIDRHCRELVKSGLVKTADYFYTQIEKSVPFYGYTSGLSNTLGRYTVEPIYMNDDFVHQRWVPSAVAVRDARTCPYKYLSEFFSKLEPDNGRPFGFLALPRKVKLSLRSVSSINLR